MEFKNTFLGIELGSTRIKAVLIDDSMNPIASGEHTWENRLENGVWTYTLDDIHTGIASCFSSLNEDVKEKFGTPLITVGAMGISAMMHGLMAFDENDRLLTPFRTWRNTMTARASEELSREFNFNIPQRWTSAHLYQAVLDNEEFVKEISYVTTLAGYIHYRLTREKTVGVGEASGIFPINNGEYDRDMINKYSALLKSQGFNKDIYTVFPKIAMAGDNCGQLTPEGARFLSPEGILQPGIPLCPPEGDAGTGMVAANAVREKTGNVSAGTSIFSMLVLDKNLSAAYPEIDMVTTPDGSPVAMVHCNNCCNELDNWVRLFGEFAALTGNKIDTSQLYKTLYENSLNADDDCNGVIAYNYLSGEPVTGCERGRPLYMRTPGKNISLADFFKAQLYSSMATLKYGMDILFINEKVTAEGFTAHGGLFKVEGVAQKYLANALDTPVSVMNTAGEGGAWGMAVLASYLVLKNELSLADFLDKRVFAGMEKKTVIPDTKGVEGFKKYMEDYIKNLPIERTF